MVDFAGLFRDIDVELAARGPVASKLVEHNPGAIQAEITAAEKRLGLVLPESLREYYLVANGSRFGDEEIVPVQELSREDDMILLHNWGNGDFTVMQAIVGPKNPVNTMLFMNHSPDVLAKLSPSFVHWILMLKDELEDRDHILHPADYRLPDSPQFGCYAHVLKKLEGVDCELNS